MHFFKSIFHSGFLAGGQEGKLKDELNAVYEIKKQMTQMGFDPGEIDYIIYENAGEKSISSWNVNTAVKVKEALFEHMKIANRCLELTKEQ